MQCPPTSLAPLLLDSLSVVTASTAPTLLALRAALDMTTRPRAALVPTASTHHADRSALPSHDEPYDVARADVDAQSVNMLVRHCAVRLVRTQTTQRVSASVIDLAMFHYPSTQCACKYDSIC